MNVPISIGFSALLSVATSIIKEINDRANIHRNDVEVQPKFCPKEGIHSNRLKKTMTKKAPLKSKVPE